MPSSVGVHHKKSSSVSDESFVIDFNNVVTMFTIYLLLFAIIFMFGFESAFKLDFTSSEPTFH